MHRGESSRRVRRRSGNADPPPPPDPTRMSDHHQSRLVNLQQCTWHPTLWLDMECLTTYGWDQSVRDHIDSIGWGFLLRAPPTYFYRQATLEFLASVSLEYTYVSTPGVPPSLGVSFWMGGAYRFMTLADFNVRMGFLTHEEVQAPDYHQLLCDRPEDWASTHMWGVLTGQTTLPAILRGTYLDIPLRICHKLLAGALFARKESQSKISQLDLFALYCMHQVIRCNPGALFVRALRDFGTRPGGSVMVSPFISPLADFWRCQDREPIPPSLAPEFIREPILLRMHLLTRSGTGYVVLSDFLDDLNFEYDLSSEGQQQPQQQQPQQQPQQQQPQQPVHPDLMAFLQSMRDDLERHFLRQQAQLDGLTTTVAAISLRLDEHDRRMQRRIPSPAHSSSSSSDDQQAE